jgi:hypothetical protein
LRSLGLAVPEAIDVRQPYEHRLDELIEQRLGDGAHSYYKSLIRRMVSYARSVDCELSQDRR